MLHFPVTPVAALGADFDSQAHITGPVDAPVTIIVFSDYQCLQCAFLAASLRQIRLTHPDDVRLIYLHAPQINRDKDGLAIKVVEAADLQGRFWEMHDLLFEKQNEWVTLSSMDFEAWVVAQVEGIGLDPIQFQSDFAGPLVAERLQQAFEVAPSDQLGTPPLLFINSTLKYTAFADFASLDTVVHLEALVSRQFDVCPLWSIDPLKQYIVTIRTLIGDIVFQLFPELAPMAVNNFVFLARSGWYDGNTFYRLLPEIRGMTGDPSGTGLGNPGYLFETEIATGLNFDQPGMLAMDNDGPGTNGSRFFITFSAIPQWNGEFTIFGKVLNGLDILASLSPRDPQPGIYLPPGNEMISIVIDER
jgi:cyclophilin family peptidyl-prolyl cis-trans isomerase/protein-disulfide isomerase